MTFTLIISLLDSFHFSASASISVVINFTSKPTWAIFPCSSLSNFVAVRAKTKKGDNHYSLETAY